MSSRSAATSSSPRSYCTPTRTNVRKTLSRAFGRAREAKQGPCLSALRPLLFAHRYQSQSRRGVFEPASAAGQIREMLTVIQDGHVRPGAITVVLTGARPPIKQSGSSPRYVGIDGRLSDLDSTAPAHFMPMISDDWTKHFRWNGDGPMPADERARLQAIVKKAHDARRVVRFWKTAESEAVWRELARGRGRSNQYRSIGTPGQISQATISGHLPSAAFASSTSF